MSMKEFQEKVASDSALAAKVESAESAEDVAKIAQAAGFDLSASDFEQLSEDDLDNVAGGHKIRWHKIFHHGKHKHGHRQD